LIPGRQGSAGATLALLCLIFFFELAAHATLLHLPPYWDEAGYYIPAAYDLFRTGSLIPFSTLSNAHPPGLSLYLAAAWKLFGFSPLVTRVSMDFAASLALLAVYRLTLQSLGSRAVATPVTLLTAAYPVWFAQSTLAHADMPAAAATLWALAFAFAPQATPTSLLAMSACFTLAALCKEIAIGTPLALAAWEAVLLMRPKKFLSSPIGDPPGGPIGGTPDGTGARRIAALCLPILPLAAWFAYHRWRTGFTFGNPEYLRYNATATLTPLRVLLALAHRVLHLSAHLNLFVPVALALGSLALPPLAGRARLSPALQNRIWIVLAANALLFSTLGGALLTRYLLPLYPLVLLLAVSAVYARFRAWLWFPAAGVAAFLAALLLPAPYRVAPEDTLAYRDAILLEQHAIAVVARDYPHGAVLSAWPVTDGLRKPELGYVTTPLPVVLIDNFSLPALQKLNGSPQSYATAIVFSTKYDPPGILSLGSWSRRQDERYFDLHHDLSPAAVAVLLGGMVVWREQRGGQWAAVLRFAHPLLADGSRSYNRQ